MPLTKFFRVAVEGPTVDGRVIERSHIQQAADSYNTDTYTATINCEHLRGYSPTPPFNSYGKIAAMKAEEIELDVSGKKEKKLALFAQFDVNDQAKKMNKDGQKLFSSIEIVPNFANSNKAYVVGLAFTDSPASLGTEILQFSRDEKRKDHLRAVEEVTIAFEAGGQDNAEVTGFFTALRDALKTFTAKETLTPPVVITPPAVDPAKDQPSADFAAFSQTIAESMSAMADAMENSVKAINGQVTKLAVDVATLKGDIEKTPATGYRQRTPANGATYDMSGAF